MPSFPIPEILRTPLESLVVQAKVHSPNLKVNDQCLGEGVQRAKKIKNSALKDLIVNENGRKYRTLIYFLIMMDLKKMYL